MSTLQVLRSKCPQFTSSTSALMQQHLIYLIKSLFAESSEQAQLSHFSSFPPRPLGTQYSSKAFTNFFWKLHPFYRRGLICLSEGPQQKHELPHSDASLRRVMTTVHTERTAAKAVLLSCRSAPTAQNQSSEDALSSRQLEKSQACKTV